MDNLRRADPVSLIPSGRWSISGRFLSNSDRSNDQPTVSVIARIAPRFRLVLAPDLYYARGGR